MVHEMMVALCVTDEAGYQQYREAMTPLLQAHCHCCPVRRCEATRSR